MKKILFGLLIFTGYTSLAQGPVRKIGNIDSVSINDQTVNITTTNAFASIIVYGPDIIRVRIDKQKLQPDFSYAVVAQPAKTNVQITQSDSDINIVTDSLKVNISKTPFAITFSTPDGKVISQDEKGLATSWVQESVTTYKKLQDGERFIGLGEKTGNLDRRGNAYTNWNSDVYGYSIYQDPLYSSIPFYIGLHHNMSYGIFLDNTYQTDFNFGASNDRFSSFGAHGGEMNYYFIYHSTLAGVITDYTSLTGRMKMPPIWSLGYQQNRYSYYPDAEVLRIAQTLRDKKIPADGITLDIHYMDKYQLFTWNKDRFPDPVGMINKLKQIGFRTTVIVDPGIKIQPGAVAYDLGAKDSVYLKYDDGNFYAARVWPGWCNFTDFTSEKGRAYWRKQMHFFTDNGVSGIWNDMNEIATQGEAVPDNVIYNFEGRQASNLEGHNVYALEMARSSYEGAVTALTNERPFILTRAGFAGLQRYAAIWTGDNRAEDDHMIAGVRLITSMGLSGVPFTGMDIGGFTGNAPVALYTRWMQLGAFIPYFRNHTQINSKSSEPWTYGEECMDISRNYISLRYKLLPYLYSTFYEATQDGLPVARSLAIDNAFDWEIYDGRFQNEYMFGKNFLVIPIESNRDLERIYLPKGNWYNLYNDNIEQGNREESIQLYTSELPVYVKESSITPMESLVQSTSIAPSDTLYLHIYKGNIANSFVYYEDDGNTFNYEKGNYYKRTITYNPADSNITLESTEGNFISKFKTIELVLHGFQDTDTLSVNNTPVVGRNSSISFLSSLSSADPLGYNSNAEACKVIIADIKNDKGKIVVGY